MGMAREIVVRGYHLKDYDWTPLSQNPAQKCNDISSVSSLGGNDICRSSILLTAVNKPPSMIFRRCWLEHFLIIEIPSPFIVDMWNHLQTTWVSVGVSYLVEQPPYCDLLRLSLLTGRFVHIWWTIPENIRCIYPLLTQGRYLIEK